MSEFYQEEFEKRMKQNMKEVKSLLEASDEKLILKIQSFSKRFFIDEKYIC